MSPISDRNLLFGILALQMNFVTRDALVSAMNAWVLCKDQPLGHILREQGAIGQVEHDLVDALVARYVANHGGDAEKSLHALAPLASVREALTTITDVDVQSSLRFLTAADDHVANAADEQSRAEPGMRYRIVRPHAKGGLGEVFVAEDTELHRQVALKEIQPRYADHPESRDRFVVEAEITGNLEHPGIVPVYGLGAHADGRPFYAMRFIQGETLKDAIAHFHGSASRDDSNVAFRGLLGRFLAVCNTVAYAHNRGVLHRDLKPANILLGDYGETLVVDWGLAKIVGRERATDARHPTGDLTVHAFSASAPLTLTGALLGTPAYMSPEQAEGRADLTCASDIYSLGATLYTLLTGQSPYAGESLEIVKKVQKGLFAPPRQVKQTVPRALEAICLKAMALRPTDRYSSASALAADVEHWLADEPVAVYREPLAARVRRWGLRHRTLVASLAALLLTTTVALAIGFLVVSAQNAKITRAESETSKALIKVTEEQKNTAAALEKSRKAEKLSIDTVSSVVHDMHAQLRGKPGLRELRKKLLNTARDGLVKVERNAETAEQIDHTTIWVHINLGDIFFSIEGASDRARAEYEQAFSLAQQLANADKSDAQAQRDLALALGKLGDVQLQQGQTKKARDSQQQARDIAKQLADADKGSAQAQSDLAAVLTSLGDVQMQMEETPQALESYQQALTIRKPLADADKNNAQAQLDMAVSLERLGDVQRQLGQTRKALDSYQQSQGVHQRVADADPGNHQAQRDLSVSFIKLGTVQMQLGQPGKAQDSFQSSRDLFKRLAQPDTVDALAQRDLFVACLKLGDAQLRLEEVEQGLDSYEQALKITKQLAAADKANASAQRDWALALERMGDVQLRLGQTEKALDSYQQELDISRRLADADKGTAQAQRDLAYSLEKVGNVQLQAGETRKALDSYRQSQTIRRQLADADKDNAEAQRELYVSLDKVGDVQMRLGETKQALNSYEESLKVSKHLAETDPDNVVSQLSLFGSCLKLGAVAKARFEYENASSWFGKGKAVVEPLHKAGKLSGQFKNAMADIDRELAFCETAEKAVADLDFAMKQPAALVPQLLNARMHRWQRQGKHAEVAATAEKLRNLADLPDTPTGSNLYNAACGYALALSCADADTQTKEDAAVKAVALLKEAREKGYFLAKKQVEQVKHKADLDPLRPRDDFKTLLAELEKDAK